MSPTIWMGNSYRFAPAGGGFTEPDDEPTIALWIRAGDETFTDAGVTPVTTDGQSVQMIRNIILTTERWHNTSAGAKPTYKTNVYNGQPCLRFDGSDFLDWTNAQHYYGTVANTLIFLLTKSSVGEHLFNGGTGEGGPSILSNIDGQKLEYFTHSTGERRTFAATPTAGLHMLVVRRTEGASTHDLIYDGALVSGSPFTNVNNGNSNWSAKYVHRIGRWFGAGSGGAVFDFCEAIHCLDRLTNAQVNNFSSYFNTRYGLSIAML